MAFDDDAERLGHAVRRQREARGLKSAELAEIAQVDPGTLSRVEHGKANPTLRIISQLADALDVPIGTLFA